MVMRRGCLCRQMRLHGTLMLVSASWMATSKCSFGTYLCCVRCEMGSLLWQTTWQSWLCSFRSAAISSSVPLQWIRIFILCIYELCCITIIISLAYVLPTLEMLRVVYSGLLLARVLLCTVGIFWVLKCRRRMRIKACALFCHC